MPAKSNHPDEYGRLRVQDKDTGAKRTILATALAHGNYAVLNEPASSPSGDPLPVEYPRQSPVEHTTASGQQADPKKENAND